MNSESCEKKQKRNITIININITKKITFILNNNNTQCLLYRGYLYWHSAPNYWRCVTCSSTASTTGETEADDIKRVSKANPKIFVCQRRDSSRLRSDSIRRRLRSDSIRRRLRSDSIRRRLRSDSIRLGRDYSRLRLRRRRRRDSTEQKVGDFLVVRHPN